MFGKAHFHVSHHRTPAEARNPTPGSTRTALSWRITAVRAALSGGRGGGFLPRWQSFIFMFSCLLVLEARRRSDITQEDRKRTSHNNHTLLFSKSGYTYVGSAFKTFKRHL